ncbi:ABC transporter substrate-binding protein [Roseomonas sp. AR75]|jgi:multiple sugar transport system substrate-binding protein|uniref:ABC transporter substrate-binding protein n=1 Tax=Roseomonas sp. AR75 TaxID=2562311 RepID=UPI0010BFFE0B|nr:extracellular solute-binding protein [Roseomonas sp. AR75]
MTTRRGILAASLASPFIVSSAARAQSNAPLQVLSHRVHQTVATGRQGGDITQPFTQATGAPVQWTTFDTGPLWERVQREATLPQTGVDVVFLLNTQVSPRAASLFEPLDARMSSKPIEDPADVFPGLIEGYKVGGALTAIPFRHASSGLHYNAELFGERGMSGPPKTIEEMAEFAKRATHRRGDGTPVTGLVMPGVTYPNVIDLARAWNGDFITPDFRCTADQPPMLNAVKLLRELFQAGAFPRNFATISTEDVNTWMQQGRGAMALNSMGRNRIYNDPQRSKFPGKVHTIAVPISETLRSQFEVAPAKVEFWGMAIPRNAQRKDLSWQFIQTMVTKPATLAAALNGNGPVRNSTYEDNRFRELIPYADEERRVLRVARVPLPAFDEAPRAGDIFKEETEAAVLGMKTPEAAMASVVQRVTPLLPRNS